MTDVSRIVEDMIRAVDEDVYRETLADRGVPWDETQERYEADITSLWRLQRLVERARVGGEKEAGRLLEMLLHQPTE